MHVNSQHLIRVTNQNLIRVTNQNLNLLARGANELLYPIQFLSSKVLGWGIVYDRDTGDGAGSRWCGGPPSLPREPERTYVFPCKAECGSPDPVTSVDGSIESSVLTFFNIDGTKKSYKLGGPINKASFLTLESIDPDSANPSVAGLDDSYTGPYTLTELEETPDTHTEMINMAINNPSGNQ